MKNRDIYWKRYKVQETLYVGQGCLSPLPSSHPRTSQFSQSPSAAPLYFPESHWWSEISFLSKVILVLEKARSHRAPNLGYSGAESPGWFDVSPKNSAWDVMYEQACCCIEAANQQLPIAAAFWVIQIVSMEECSSLMQNLMQIHCSTHTVILNVTAIYNTHAHSIASPAPLTSTVKLLLFTYAILVHSSWLPGYMDVMQTILIILTMAGLFPDRPHIP